MPRKLSNKIPTWFDLDKYCDDSCQIEFAYQIYIRNAISGGSWKVKQEHVDSGKAAEFFSKIMNNGWESMRKSFEIKKEIAQLARTKPISESIFITNNTGFLSLDPFASDLFGKWDHIAHGERVLHLDLRFSDDELKKAFNLHLKKQRREADKLNFLSADMDKTIKEWVHCKTLAAFDLLFWREATGGDISYETIAKALGYVQGEQRLKKTVIPKIKEMLMDGVVELILERNLRR